MLPRTCVIGAGISGLNAGKALADAGVPYDASRARTGSAATGRSATPTATPAPTARCTSTRPRTSCPSATSPWTRRTPTSRTTSRSSSTWSGTRTLRAQGADRVRDARGERAAPERRRLGDPDLGRPDAPFRRARGGQRAPLGPAAAGLPGRVQRRVDPLACLPVAHRAAASARQADPGGGHRQQRGRHHQRAVPEDAGQRGGAVHPLGRLGGAQVRLRQAQRRGGQDAACTCR